MLPMVMSPTNSRLGHLLITCSTAAVVSPGERPCLPGTEQGHLGPAVAQKRLQSTNQPMPLEFPVQLAGQTFPRSHKEPLTVLPAGVNLHHDLQLLG